MAFDVPADWIGSEVTMMLKLGVSKNEITLAGGTIMAVLPGAVMVRADNKENIFNLDHVIHISKMSAIAIPKPSITLS